MISLLSVLVYGWVVIWESCMGFRWLMVDNSFEREFVLLVNGDLFVIYL